MQKIAYGFLGLKPREFWKLSPKEYFLMIEGHKEKEEFELQKRAQHAAWVVQPHVKNKVTPDMLLQKKRTQEDAQASQEVFDQAPDTLPGR
jgi:hypothetical protein